MPADAPPLKEVFRSLAVSARKLTALDDDIRRSIVRIEMLLRQRNITQREYVTLAPGVRLTWSRYEKVWQFVIRDEEADPIRLIEATPEEWVEVLTNDAFLPRLLRRLGAIKS